MRPGQRAELRFDAYPGIVLDRMNAWAQGEGQPGLAYIFFREGEAAGPVGKNIGPERAGARGRPAAHTLKVRLATPSTSSVLPVRYAPAGEAR